MCACTGQHEGIGCRHWGPLGEGEGTIVVGACCVHSPGESVQPGHGRDRLGCPFVVTVRDQLLGGLVERSVCRNAGHGERQAAAQQPVPTARGGGRCEVDGLGEQSSGGRVGVERERTVPGRVQRLDRTLKDVIPRCRYRALKPDQEVMHQRLGPPRAVSRETLEPVGRTQVPLCTFNPQDASVGDVAHQRVLEHVLGLSRH